MQLLIISDFHIRGTSDPMYATLLRLLSKLEKDDVFVVAGDLFDLFIGAKSVFTGQYSAFLEELHRASAKGVCLHYVEGNHDFFMAPAFSGIRGMEVHDEVARFELGGKRFCIAHGDTANPKDYGYRLLRWLFRSPLMKLAVALTPGAWLEWFGKYSSHLSSERRRQNEARRPSARWQEIYRLYARRLFGLGCDFVILGHAHAADEELAQVGGRACQYVNVGYPRVTESCLRWRPGEERVTRVLLRELQ